MCLCVWNRLGITRERIIKMHVQQGATPPCISQWPTKLLMFGEDMKSDQLHVPVIGTVDFGFSLTLFALRSLTFHLVWSGFWLRHPQGIDYFNLLKFHFRVLTLSAVCVCVSYASALAAGNSPAAKRWLEFDSYLEAPRVCSCAGLQG